MKNEEYFWNIAKDTEFYNYLKEFKEESIKNERIKGEESLKEFRRIAKYESDCVGEG